MRSQAALQNLPSNVHSSGIHIVQHRPDAIDRWIDTLWFIPARTSLSSSEEQPDLWRAD